VQVVSYLETTQKHKQTIKRLTKYTHTFHFPSIYSIPSTHAHTHTRKMAVIAATKSTSSSHIYGFAPSTAVLWKISKDSDPSISSLLDLWETCEEYNAMQSKQTILNDTHMPNSVAATAQSVVKQIKPFETMSVWSGEAKGGWTKVINVVQYPNTTPLVRMTHALSGATIDVCSSHPTDFILSQETYPYMPPPNWMYCENNPLLAAQRLLDAVSHAQYKAQYGEDDGLGHLSWCVSETERREVFKAFVEIRCKALRGKSHNYYEYHLGEELHFQLDSPTSAAQWALFTNTLKVALVLADAPPDAFAPEKYREEWVWVRTYPAKNHNVPDPTPPSKNAVTQVKLSRDIPQFVFSLETENGHFCAGVGNLLVGAK
jgi:hypothetical protein